MDFEKRIIIFGFCRSIKVINLHGIIVSNTICTNVTWRTLLQSALETFTKYFVTLARPLITAQVKGVQPSCNDTTHS